MSETWRAGTLEFITYRSDFEPSVHSDFLFDPLMSSMLAHMVMREIWRVGTLDFITHGSDVSSMSALSFTYM